VSGWTSRVRQFSDTYTPTPHPQTPTKIPSDQVEFLAKMVNDELEELRDATETIDQTDALLDIIYYVLDRAVAHGMNLDPHFDIVHAANMRKFPDGVAIRRDDGKVMKPEGWYGPEAEMLKVEKEHIENGSWSL
jgi:predicted HAD superfamily Cof-like phosphohydrolase